MIAIGSNFYRKDAESDGRQARARAALLALDGVLPFNLQFTDEVFTPDGFRTLPVLRQDSRTVTGAAGARKPIVSEMFGALAEAARASGCRYFVYLNNDIEVHREALEPILAGQHDGLAFSRMDVDPASGAEVGVQIFGLDMFAVDVAWWAREQRRFRPYIAGEACWDNVYAAILCGHGRGAIVNERPAIFHRTHAALWHDGPFAAHNGFLAALDAPYFSRWAAYSMSLETHLNGGTPVDRDALMRATLADPRLPAREAAIHLARQLRARLKYARLRAGWASATEQPRAV